MKSLVTFVLSLSVLFNSIPSLANSDPDICSKIEHYLRDSALVEQENPARDPTSAEMSVINSAEIDLLEHPDYESGVSIIDVDNDGRDEILAWNIQGTGRFVNAEVYVLPDQEQNKATPLEKKFSVTLGVLESPRIIRFHGVNYFLTSYIGNDADLSVSHVVRSSTGKYELQTLCRTQPILSTESTCKHPACRRLSELIEDPKENRVFSEVQWPHKYLQQAGISVYFPENGSYGDFDNTGHPTSIFRIGREGYIYQHIYWALLGEGDSMPDVDPVLRPKFDHNLDRSVLPGEQHARLRQALAMQSKALSEALHQHYVLPRIGEFFLFNASNKTYWGWDFGEEPSGQAIHIMYTDAKESGYIGMVKIKTTFKLNACSEDCVDPSY